MEARTALRYGVVEPASAEALEILQGSRWINEKQWGQVLLESDCLVYTSNMHELPSVFLFWPSDYCLSILARKYDPHIGWG